MTTRWLLPDPAREAELGHPSTRLAAYGTLRPGQPFHHMLAGLGERWSPGVIRGALGVRNGYPAFTWSPDGDPVPVQVLTSPDLPAHWERLDAFEVGYRRVWLEVEQPGGLIIASCYEAIPRPPG
jgi:gamma-glutamylcyclotransferase (GGCT)/AIG2-like uncharacterized protein YtfP